MPRSLGPRLCVVVPGLLLAFSAAGARGQDPSNWDHFDEGDPVRRLENRFALIASDA